MLSWFPLNQSSGKLQASKIYFFIPQARKHLISSWGWGCEVDCQNSFFPCCSENIGTSRRAGRENIFRWSSYSVVHRIITKWNNFQLFLPTFSTKMSKNELQPIRTNLSRNIIVRKAPLIFCFLFIFVLKTMRNCSKPPCLTVVVQSRSPSTTHRLDVVVHNGGNLDLNFFKSSILSQPLALDPHHLVVPASLCSRIVMMMMMVVMMKMVMVVIGKYVEAHRW